MHALDDVGDALDATRALLWPFDRGRWGRLAVVTLLLGGVGSGFSLPQVSLSGGPGDPGSVPAPDPGAAVPILLVVGGLALLVALAVGAVRGVMDFVLVESLREESVELRRFWAARWRQGLRLFAFRLAVNVATLLLVGVPVALIATAGLAGGTAGAVGVAVGALVLLPVLFVVPAGSGVVRGFTTAFVVPVVVLEGGGVLDGWRRLWPTLRAEWKEFLAYAAVNLVLAVAGGVVVGLGTVLGAVVLAIPALPVAALGFLALQASALAGGVVLGLVGLLYALALVAVWALLKAPVVAYLRYYALFVLGDADGDLDAIPLRRRQVRGEAE